MSKSAYEQEIEENIKQRKEFLKTVITDIQDFIKTENITPKKSNQSKRKTSRPRKLSSQLTPPSSPPRTRSRSGSLRKNYSDPITPENHNQEDRLLVKLPFGSRFGRKFDPQPLRVYEDSSSNDEDESGPKKKRKKHSISRAKFIPADEITDDDLDAVAVCTGEKIYNSYNGTTCHQCRQKTSDQKTICRSGKCMGVRGQFCGPCLLNRYGESAKEALIDPNWTCPPCRGICNCSFCRRRGGYLCTGIMIHEAKHFGFDSVRQYLESREKESESS